MVNRCLRPLFSNRFQCHFLLRCLYSGSKTSPAVSEHKQSAAATQQKVLKRPFVKNLFLGIYDVDILTFPETLDNERLSYIEDLALKLKTSLEKSGSQEPSTSKLKIIRECGVPIGLGIPTAYGGGGLTSTECLRLSEVIGVDPSTAFTLEIQNLVVHILKKFGTKEQRNRYLQRLCSGEELACYALSEDVTGSDPASLKTSAVLNDDTGSWVINGQKLWIANAEDAKFLLGFVKTPSDNKMACSEELSVFWIDKDTPGITCEKLDVSVLKQCPLYKVVFNNVHVPKDNRIGSFGDGYDIAVAGLTQQKYILASCMVQNLKWMLSESTEFIKNRKQLLMDLRESELVKQKLANVSSAIYAAESMLYLTSGVDDQYDCDLSLESVIFQVFTREILLKEMNTCTTLLGSKHLDKSNGFIELKEDLHALNFSLQTLDILKLFIAMHGLQYAGNNLHSEIRKTRNPLNYPKFIFKKMFADNRQMKDDPILNLDLYMQLHPTLKPSADQLEYSVLRLKFAVEIMLSRHGAEVMKRQTELTRLADVVIDIFAMTSVLSRSSRSYCTGIRYSDQEMFLANTFCHDAVLRIKKNIKHIVEGTLGSNDIVNFKIASQIVKTSGYFVEHPLKRNIS